MGLFQRLPESIQLYIIYILECIIYYCKAFLHDNIPPALRPTIKHASSKSLLRSFNRIKKVRNTLTKNIGKSVKKIKHKIKDALNNDSSESSSSSSSDSD